MKIVLITVSLYIGCVLFGILYNAFLLKTKWLDHIKLKGEQPDPIRVRQHMPLISLNIITLAVIIPILIYLFRDTLIIQIPSFSILLLQFLLYLVCDDLVVYLWHRLLHENKFLLRRIHSVHHRVRYPTPLEFIYVHPIEWLIAPMGIVVAALIMEAWFGQINVCVLWLYASFRTIVELDIHSNTRSLLFKYFPIFVDAEHHSIHHQKAKGNYASMLRYLDKVFHTTTR